MSRSNADSQETMLLKEAVQGVARLHSNPSEFISDLAARIDRLQATVEPNPYGVNYIWDTKAASTPGGFVPKTASLQSLNVLRERAGIKEDPEKS